ncbi:hypothetical protein, partial [Xanthomonas phaseoli]|uniref:hypothetical protein n=1 Tax=Xanthomonas phaseoli TaxID=1985254 RepID=UPI001EE67206
GTSSWNLLEKGYEKIPLLASANGRGDYHWTAEMRGCVEYLGSLPLCEGGNPIRGHGIARWQADATIQVLSVLSSKDAGV